MSPTPQTAGPCPSWCSLDHTEQAPTASSWHDSDLLVIPIIELRASEHDGVLSYASAACHLQLGIERRVGDRESFIHLSVDGQRTRSIHLSIESAHRLADGLLEQLQREVGA